MNGRSTVLILFFWALLTVITPTLIRMSAKAKLLDISGTLSFIYIFTKLNGKLV